MAGYSLRTRIIAPDCPCCGRQIFLTMGAAVAVDPADGMVVCDGDLAKRGLLLHMRRCQEDYE